MTPAGEDATPPSENLRILVVDDEVEIAEILRDMLVSAGHGVSVVASGHEALVRLAEDGFDLVFTDLKMPDMDGPGLYREIAARFHRLARRVVVVTGDTLGGAARRFLDEAGLPVLEKPFTQAAVLEAARRYGTRPPE